MAETVFGALVAGGGGVEGVEDGAGGFGSEGGWHCGVVAERAAGLFILRFKVEIGLVFEIL
jgi:hypothetical protein